MKLDVKVNTKFNDRKVMEGMKKALAEVMHIVEFHGVRLCPVDTGRLRNSLNLKKVNDFRWIFADGVDYGIYQEYGTIKMAAQPFMRPARDIGVQEIPNVVNRHIGVN